ncbi:MAG: Holliday junction branch migration protein RuvA, partial [Bacteroidota bacterium]
MITYVSGTLVAKKPTEAVIDVQGLGYEVLIPASSFDKLPAVGSPAKLLTIHHVREDAALLFGFATDAERALFREMTSVSGVGPKLALAALSAMAPAELRAAVIADDAAMLTRIPGVGKKTAQRLCVELRDRLAKLDGLGQADLGGDGESAA